MNHLGYFVDVDGVVSPGSLGYDAVLTPGGAPRLLLKQVGGSSVELGMDKRTGELEGGLGGHSGVCSW